MVKKIFLSFADSRMEDSLKRIKLQAAEMNVYDEIRVCTENQLPSDFREKFKNKLIPGTRGYGYWSWKPALILETLKNSNEGDVINYVDAGCHLNPGGRARLHDYFEMVCNPNSFPLLTFQSRLPEAPLYDPNINYTIWKDREWCKGDLLDHFGVRERPDVTETGTIGATISMICKRDISYELVKRWLETFTDNFHLIDDTPSQSPNLPGFQEHRHDQSIFSILSKIYGVQTLSAFECWHPSQNNSAEPDWLRLDKYPIHIRRDRGVKKDLRFRIEKIKKSIKKRF